MPHDAAQAELTISVGPTGSAHADVRLAPELEEALRPTAQRIAASVFGARLSTVGLDGSDGGFDFAVITARDVYEPGSRPIVEISIKDDAVDVLRGLARRTLSLRLTCPWNQGRQSSMRL